MHFFGSCVIFSIMTSDILYEGFPCVKENILDFILYLCPIFGVILL